MLPVQHRLERCSANISAAYCEETFLSEVRGLQMEPQGAIHASGVPTIGPALPPPPHKLVPFRRVANTPTTFLRPTMQVVKTTDAEI